MPGPGLNQHDQLDKDEWFSTRGYFFPAASGSLQNWPLSPVGSVSPTSCALFLLNLDLDLDLNLDLDFFPYWDLLPPPLFLLNLDQLVGQLCGTKLVEPTKEIRPKSADKKRHN